MRLEPRQGEYWVFSLMLAGLKTLRSRCTERPHPLYRYGQGYFADLLHEVLATLRCCCAGAARAISSPNGGRCTSR